VFRRLGGLTAACIVSNVIYTVPAVPEPSTWAMLILGFAGIGLMASPQQSGQRPLDGFGSSLGARYWPFNQAHTAHATINTPSTKHMASRRASFRISQPRWLSPKLPQLIH
jgi:hypothetical protein